MNVFNSNWLKNNKLPACFVLFGLIFSFFQINLFSKIFSFNIVLVFLPVLFFFLAFLIKSKEKSMLVASMSVTIAIFIFLFQNFKADKEKAEFINWVNEYNCEVVVSDCLALEKLEDKGRQYVSENFMLEPYRSNMTFVYNKIGEEAAKSILSSLLTMEIVSGYMDTVKKLNIEFAATNDSVLQCSIKDQIVKHNKAIIEKFMSLRTKPHTA